MFRFAMHREDVTAVTEKQLISHNISVDEDLVEILGDEARDDERYFRAENVDPASPEEAVAFVKGIFFFPPRRVWLGGEAHVLEAGEKRAQG